MTLCKLKLVVRRQSAFSPVFDVHVILQEPCILTIISNQIAFQPKADPGMCIKLHFYDLDTTLISELDLSM